MMTNSVDIHTQLASIMEVFAKSALAEMSKAIDNDSTLLRQEISRREREIEALWRRLQLTENELKSARQTQAKKSPANSRSVGIQVNDGASRAQAGISHWSSSLIPDRGSTSEWKDAIGQAFPLQVEVDEEEEDEDEEHGPFQIKEEKAEEEQWNKGDGGALVDGGECWEEDVEEESTSTPGEVAVEPLGQRAPGEPKLYSAPWEDCDPEEGEASIDPAHPAEAPPPSLPLPMMPHLLQSPHPLSHHPPPPLPLPPPPPPAPHLLLRDQRCLLASHHQDPHPHPHPPPPPALPVSHHHADVSSGYSSAADHPSVSVGVGGVAGGLSGGVAGASGEVGGVEGRGGDGGVGKRSRCGQCGKTFTTHFYLKIHQRIHTGERPFTCTACGKRFYCTSHLISHQRCHTGEKPYSCLECGKAYSHLNSLKLHQRSHADDQGLGYA